MRRYWFILDIDQPYGTRNIGVTTFSEEDARTFAEQAINNFSWPDHYRLMLTSAECMVDINVQLLDQDHVIPNIGAVTFRGVWWPRMNM
jgi:hypothetical protein